MAQTAFSTKIDETAVPKVDDAVAVGEDLTFQEHWWTFERLIWSFFVLVLVADALGLFGQGWLAKATAGGQQNALTLRYERIERATTPSQLEVRFDPAAATNGAYQLFVSDSVIGDLGAQRIAPQPAGSQIGNGGITYTFPSIGGAARVLIELEPAKIGVHHFTVQVPGHPAIQTRVVVLP